MEINFKVLKCKNERYKRTELKGSMRKMGSLVQVMMFTTRIMVIKMSKMAFLHFLLMTAKDQSQFGQNIYLHLKDFSELFQKMVCLIGFAVTVSEISRVEKIKNCQKAKIPKPCICKSRRLPNGSSESNNPKHFLTVLNKIFQMLLNNLPKP